jgi:hypothetical protein
MNFGNTMLSEMSDTKGQILYHSTYEVPRIGKFRENKEWLLMKMGILCGVMKMFWN